MYKKWNGKNFLHHINAKQELEAMSTHDKYLLNLAIGATEAFSFWF